MSAITTRLRTLQTKATEKGQWPLVCRLQPLSATIPAWTIASTSSERCTKALSFATVFNLSGPLARSDALAPASAHRCIERLLASDHDYWAVAGVLGLPLAVVRSSVSHFRFRLISIRFAQSFKENERHIAVLCLNRSDRIISPVLEIGWDSVTAEVVEMSRWRAILLEQQMIQHGNLIGHGSGSYFLRELPYGAWRLVETEFRLLAEWSVAHEQTLLSDYE